MILNRSPSIRSLHISRVPPFPFFHGYLFYTFLNDEPPSAMNALRQKRIFIQQQQDNLYAPPGLLRASIQSRPAPVAIAGPMRQGAFERTGGKSLYSRRNEATI